MNYDLDPNLWTPAEREFLIAAPVAVRFTKSQAAFLLDLEMSSDSGRGHFLADGRTVMIDSGIRLALLSRVDRSRNYHDSAARSERERAQRIIDRIALVDSQWSVKP